MSPATPNVLVVEDNPDLREDLVTLLQQAGYRVTGAGSGLEFYQEIGRQPYRLALIDLGLPDQAGEVLVEYTSRNTNTAVIVITARDTVATRVTSYKMGADLFLGKPLNADELLAAVEHLTQRPPADPVPAATPITDPESPQDAPWRLRTTVRHLITPEQLAIDLTGNECDLLHCLGRHRGTVERPQILLEVKIQAAANPHRALEELVRRLRHKISTKSAKPPPILTHYGLGYAFAGQLAVEE